MLLPPRLRDWQKKIEDYALEFGLTFPPVDFEILSYKEMQEVRAYTGFPVRYPHWTFGQEFFNASKQDEWGMGRVYELVLNTRPAHAFLLEGNSDVIQKMVMAHVYGHADFFENNIWYRKTNRKMLDTMANYSTIINTLIEKQGRDTVELFLDKCKSLDNLIDTAILCEPPRRKQKKQNKATCNGCRKNITIAKIKADHIMDDFLNPKDWLELKKAKKIQKSKNKKFPSHPDKNVLRFILEHSNKLAPWQRTILSIIHNEAYYFLPQMMTKIANEGWAVFVHSNLMIHKIITSDEAVEYAYINAGVTAPHPRSLNPYRLGWLLYKHIQDKWNKGRFGDEYIQCNDYKKKKEWDTKVGLGMQKVFEIRKLVNDRSFINTYFDREFCEDSDFFVKKQKPTEEDEKNAYKYEQVKHTLLTMLTNGGRPIIQIEDANYNDNDELLLTHEHLGPNLDKEKTETVMKTLYGMWGKAIYLQTKKSTKSSTDKVLFKYSASGFSLVK